MRYLLTLIILALCSCEAYAVTPQTFNGVAGGVTGNVNGAAIPASKTIVGTNASSQIVDASSATLSNNTSGTAGGLSGIPSITVNTVSSGYSSSAAFVSGAGNVSALSATPTTLFTLPGTGLYSVYCFLNANDAPNFSAYAMIAKEGTSQTILSQVDAPLMHITLSGADVQGRQNSGITFTISYAYHRIQ